jgi:hypothetical protein
MVEKRSCSLSMSHAAATGLEASVLFRLSMLLECPCGICGVKRIIL